MFIISMILLQILIFAGLAFFLRYFLKSNVTDATSHLHGMIKENVDKQEEIKQKMEKSEQEYQDIIRKGKREVQDMRDEAQKAVEEERDKIIAQAHQQSEDLIERAQKTCENIKSQVQDQINKEAIKRAGGLISQVIPKETCKLIHKQWVISLIEDGLSGFDRLRVPDNIKEAEVFTAFALEKKQKEDLEKRLSSVLEQKIKVKEKVKEELIAGMIITLGNLIFDGSFSFKISEVVRESISKEQQ